MKLSIIVPVYNEARHLGRFMDSLLNFPFQLPTEILVIDDGSSDGTWQVLQKYAHHKQLKCLQQQKNMGKGSAIHRGIGEATGELIAIQDADFEYALKDLDDLSQVVAKGEADVVYGSRFIPPTRVVHRTYHYLINRVLTLLSNFLSGLYLTDMETCYKVFRADLIKGIRLESKRFGFEPEITAKIAKLHLRVHESPISYFPRTKLQGKKITWQDGVAAIWYMLKYNLQSIKKSITPQLPKHYLPEPC